MSSPNAIAFARRSPTLRRAPSAPHLRGTGMVVDPFSALRLLHSNVPDCPAPGTPLQQRMVLSPGRGAPRPADNGATSAPTQTPEAGAQPLSRSGSPSRNRAVATILGSPPESPAQEEDILHLQKEAFNLSNYFFVFQGVIFTAFYSLPSQLKCKYRWVPFTLSLLAGCLNLWALLKISWKYKNALDVHSCRLNRVGIEGAIERRGGARANNRTTANWRMLYALVAMCLFIGFLVVTLVGCWKITCSNLGNDLKSAGPPS